MQKNTDYPSSNRRQISTRYIYLILILQNYQFVAFVLYSIKTKTINLWPYNYQFVAFDYQFVAF